MALQHIRSGTADKRPVASSLADGQIAINYQADSPGAFFKDSGGNLVKVGPIHVGTTAPNATPAGSSGNSLGEGWLDTSGADPLLKAWDGSAWVPAKTDVWTRTGTALSPTTSGDTVDTQYLTFTQDGTGAVARTGEAKLKDIISVKDFGAVGDGVTDDTAAIQAAIDAAEVFVELGTASQTIRNDGNRGVVWFPPGQYNVSSTLVINGPGVHIQGSGVAATIIRSTLNGNLFYARSDDQSTTGLLHNIAFSDMSLRGDFTNPTTGAGIAVDIVKHVYIYNIHFNGFYDDIVFRGVQEPAFVHGCNFFANNAVTAARTGNAHIKVGAMPVGAGSTNAMAGPDGGGIYYAYSVNVMVSNCEMRSAAGYKQFGVLVEACDGFYLQNCHLLNQQEQLRVSRSNSVSPCANVRIQNCFFDGESPTTLRNVYIVSTLAQDGPAAMADVFVSGCKFNGVGDNAGGVEAWFLVDDVALRSLSLKGNFFDKARNETAAGIELKKGGHLCDISGNVFFLEENNVPTVIIRSNASAEAAANLFDNICIDANKFICVGTLDRPDYNIRLANEQNKVAIANNMYYADSGAGGDGLIYDTKTTGTTYGSGTTNNNIDLS